MEHWPVDLVSTRPTLETKIVTAIEFRWDELVFQRAREESRSLISFCKNAGVVNGVFVTTGTRSGTKNIAGIEVSFLPAAVGAYSDGKMFFEELSKPATSQ